MYELRILEPAKSGLAALDRTVARRIVRRLRWLSKNFENIKPESLTGGHLAGMYKLRIGDFRVVYETLRAERILIVHLVGHRSEVYRRKS